MKGTKLILTALALALTLSAAAQAPIARKGVENPDKWIQAAFGKGAVPPFSFTLDGVPSEKFIKGWEYNKKKLTPKEPGSVCYEFSYRDKKSGLKVTATVTGYTDFPAVEWVLRLAATGSGNTGRIANLNAADFSVKEKGVAGWKMRRCKGSCASVYDFSIIEESLAEGQKLNLKTDAGRSSDEFALPFFNVTADGAGDGFVFGIGWTGSWKADFATAGGACTVKMGLENADFYLKKGEDVRTPMASVLFWTGKDDMAGHNAFRKFVLAHHSRKIDGKPWTPLLGGLDWGDPSPCNEYTCLTDELARAIVRRYKQFDIMPEVFWLDAGWYSTSDGNHFNGDFR